MATATLQATQYGPERVTHGRRDVVTGFVQRPSDGKVLVVHRSAEVRTYPLKFGGVSGGVEEGDTSLVQRALQEIFEEVGYTRDHVALVRSGRPLLVDDGEFRFAVHPYLFSLTADAPPPVLNWENIDAQFVEPDDIGKPGAIEDTVPLLTETLARLLLTPGQEAGLRRIAQDRTHGAAELAKQALCILEDEVAALANSSVGGAAALEALRNFGYHLAACRPSMVPVANAVAAVLGTLHRSLRARGETFEEIHQLLNQALAAQHVHLDGIAARLRRNVMARLGDGMTVMTISLSSTVRDAMLAAAADGRRMRAVVCESRPLFEGVALAGAWAQGGIHVEVITDAQAAIFMRRVDLVLVGADALEVDGAINKAGSRLLALAALPEGVPVVVAADSTKLSAGSMEEIAHPGGEEGEPAREEQSAAEVTQAWPELPTGVGARNIYFECTPYSLVAHVITEEGELDPAAVSSQVASLRGIYTAAFGLA